MIPAEGRTEYVQVQNAAANTDGGESSRFECAVIVPNIEL
jgi:hypothetical protein